MMKKLLLAMSASVVVMAVLAAPSFAEFGFSSLGSKFSAEDGSPDAQAGSHPFAYSTSLGFTLKPDPKKPGSEIPDGQAKDVIVQLPPGFAGDPTAVPRCAPVDFVKIVEGGTSCLSSTALGVAHVLVEYESPPKEYDFAVYNLIPPPGVAAMIGFVALGVPVPIELNVNPNPPYNVIATTRNISQAIRFYGTTISVWGDPASPAHDKERGSCATVPNTSCPTTSAQTPFVTLPTSCAGPLVSGFEADSWEDPGVWVKGSAESVDGSVPPKPLGLVGCSKLAFKPTIEATPTTVDGESPSGLDFQLSVNDEGLTSPTGQSQSDIKKVVVELPEALSVNPALAEGLAACSEADLAKEAIDSVPGEGCPNESKIGTVEVETPLLEERLDGSLFLATPYENPGKSLIGLYVVVKNPQTGILLKLSGKVVANERTGQLVSEFDNLPQLPFSHFRLHFRQGQRSPLVTPAACGTYATRAELTPWANPESVLQDTATFQVTSGIAGSACLAGGVLPFHPGLIAGTENNSAGSYSPMDIRITRNDGEQEITGFSSVLPAGVTASLAGVPFCSEAQIAQAKEEGGAREEVEPSCPISSQIGHTLVGVGVGSVLAYVPGRLYMAGPFEGAPFSVVAITSAKVGPFDLGTVVVHLPLNIDPVTAQVSIPAGAADQIPHIVRGIVVHVRDIRVYVDRPSFTVNPTNCAPLSLTATVYGAGQDAASPADDVPSTVTDRFQAANCANLAFKPTFKASTSARTSRVNGASLHVSLAYPPDSLGKDANIRSVKVDLPKQLPSRLTTLQKACTEQQFAANPAACPAGSRVGTAKALTPILPVPLEGPAYFVSHGGAKFPELVIVLQGYGVTIDLHGETFIDKTGITSSTFRTVPDQPVTSFELTLPQGPGSALAANADLCNITKVLTSRRSVTIDVHGRKRRITRQVKTRVATGLQMPTAFVGQNGMTVKQTTAIEVIGCPKKKASKAKQAARARKAVHGLIRGGER